ncbi:TerB N-terminal domain-containing protein [Pseudomonas syringae]|nr:TerB N-terminal domain-containing protein [Pseudomonas syringae]MBD8792396.1 TerB N-terminal domain-containing protein [Pseudomonas syringae]MBD8802134.1 TerB N-terminal domain-containing protein [Pseudomonas syringae]MBD8813903.1 TerB N-terminal domain-containing protein [Pseudomonas syringae]
MAHKHPDTLCDPRQPILESIDHAAQQSARYSRPSCNLVGGTFPYPDDYRHYTPSAGIVAFEETSLPGSRYSHPSSNLIGGTVPCPDDYRHAASPAKTAVQQDACPHDLRYSRPSLNLIGGTVPYPDDYRSAAHAMPVNKAQPDSAFFTLHQDPSGHNAFIIPSAPERLSETRWLTAGESIMVADQLLPDGMIYVGTNDSAFRFAEPSFIDSTLKVHEAPVDLQEKLTPGWPSYSNLSPHARRGYLQWLASGRCTPLADPGYVSLFFYGLERRALVDSAHDTVARTELGTIAAEVLRLQKLYTGHADFQSDAKRLLDHLSLARIDAQMYLQTPPDVTDHDYDLPTLVRVALGQLAVDKHPMDAGWAWAWARSDPNISRRTPVFRCADLFQRLFKASYEQRFPNGLMLANNKTRLRIAYRPTSLRLIVPEIAVGNIPDVTAISSTRKKLQLLIDECATALDPFSRYLGRNPDAAEALEGLLHLPIWLWPEHARFALQDLQSRTGHEVLSMRMGELAEHFQTTGSLARDQVIVLAKTLETLGIGMEPDVLSGGRTPKADEIIALFATEPDDGTLRTTADYHAALVTLELACAVAAADGDTSPAEVALVGRHIDSWNHLCVAHRKRLKAHLHIQLQQPPTLASLKKKLDPLSPAQRRTIAGFLAHLAQADGIVSPEEVRLLERVYKVLQLDPQLLYNDLHGAAGSLAQQSSIASGPAAPSSGIVLDMSKIAQLQRETAQVSALLAKVFEDEYTEEPVLHLAPQPSLPEPDTQLYGLDAEHSAFMRLLLSRNEWSRHDLEDAAADMELMLDGALEQINDMGFEHFNMPISEGDDPIEINPDILSELSL